MPKDAFGLDIAHVPLVPYTKTPIFVAPGTGGAVGGKTIDLRMTSPSNHAGERAVLSPRR